MANTTLGSERLLSELRRLLPSAEITTSAEAMRKYEADYYWPAVVGSRGGGIPLGTPDVVVHPNDEGDVCQVLRFATKSGVPVVPWGGGSGTQGAAVPVRGGIVLDLRSMNRVLEVNLENYTVRVQAGMNGADLESHLNELGLMFPHYPASANLATVGGYIAALGSGVLSTRYGKIEDLIVSLRCVLPSGDVVNSLPIPRHGAGPDAARLMVGAEGTFGVITEATFRVIPLPAERGFGTTLFPTISHGIAAYREAMVKGVRPAVIRLYDEKATTQSLAKVISDLDTSDGVISVEMFEGEGAICRAEQEVMNEIAARHGGRQIGPRIAQDWWANRYAFYRPPHYPQLPTMWGTLDVVAPYDALERAYAAVQVAVGERFADVGLQLRTHFSHWYPWGAMFYGRFVIDEPVGDVMALHDEIWRTGITAVLDAGAVINDHHGVGLKLAPFMRRQHGANLDLLRRFKESIDPAGIMNPGKLDLDGS